MKNFGAFRGSNYKPLEPDPRYKVKRRKTETGMEESSTFLDMDMEDFDIDKYIASELFKVQIQRDNYDKYFNDISEYFEKHSNEKVIEYNFNESHSELFPRSEEIPYLQMKAISNFLKTIEDKYNYDIDHIIIKKNNREDDPLGLKWEFYNCYRITMQKKI